MRTRVECTEEAACWNDSHAVPSRGPLSVQILHGSIVTGGPAAVMSTQCFPILTCSVISTLGPVAAAVRCTWGRCPTDYLFIRLRSPTFPTTTRTRNWIVCALASFLTSTAYIPTFIVRAPWTGVRNGQWRRQGRCALEWPVQDAETID